MSNIRTFDSGATRDQNDDKFDYEGFLSPLVIEGFGAYMHRHRKQSDGSMRASDNWQKGIPRAEYVKSLWRHFLDVWKIHRGIGVFDKSDGHEVTIEEALFAMFFNVQGLLHEVLKHDKLSPPALPLAAGVATAQDETQAE